MGGQLPATTTPRARRRRSGLTLVELLAAMAIFLGLAGMILQVLGGGLDLWTSGERTRDESEQAAVLLDRLSAELRHAVSSDGGEGEPRVKMLCDFVAYDADGDGTRDFRAQRLLFVRRLFEERSSTTLQRAGTASGSAVAFTGTIDSSRADYMATEGLTEVAFLPQPDPRAGYEGRAILWRALRSPIGGKESLFQVALQDEQGLEGAALEPLAENVLWIGFAFVDESVHDVATRSGDGGEGGGALVLWDSTRALLPAGDGFNGFRHARGKGSLADPDDDVFPDAVRISVILAAPPGETPAATTTVDMPGGGGALRVEVQNGRYLAKLGATSRLLKIGHEWVEAGPSDGVAVSITQRGLLGTAATPHPAGSKVLTGRRFERVVPLPAARSDLVSRDLKRAHR
jgi:hypothetical protein